MYHYIYDSFLNDKRYSNILAKIETRLTDLGINGKINHLSFLKNIHQILNEEIRRGVKTIVIVGNDKTIGQVINIIADLDIVIGIIPIGKEKNNIAKLFGIPEGEKACNTLSCRIVKKIDLGKINNYYFITSVEIFGKNITFECDNNYFIDLKGHNSINISNLNFCYQTMTNPKDNQLNIFIKNIRRKVWGKSETNLSHLTAKTIKINSRKPIPILLNDDKKIIKTPAEVRTISQKIRVITGKNRLF